MLRLGLIPTTLATVLLTGVALTQAGWFTSHASQVAATHRTPAYTQARATEPFTSQAAWRWRQGQPTHWRACMLQR